jgi:MerR family transcriptional regulator, thiopeptide resistance regulator
LTLTLGEALNSGPLGGETVSYSVGQVADLAGVTIRTLHHYDEIGLLSPSRRSAAGYRIYEEPDLERLQQILFYRELGFALEEIAAIVDDPQTDAVDHLRRQRGLLTEKIERLQKMVAAIDHEMEARDMGIKLTPEERMKVFGDFDPEDHAEEAERRWGGTDAYRQSQRRVSSYTKEDWLKIKAEHDEVAASLVALFESGAAPDSEEAMDAAEAHRRHISRWYYDCSHEIHRGLGEMYVSDERFRANYDLLAPGLSEFICDATRANAERASATSNA